MLKFIGFPFRVKIVLLLVSLFCAILIVLIKKSPVTYAFHLVIWVLWVLAVLPSVISLLPEVFAQIAYELRKVFRQIVRTWKEIQPDSDTVLAFERLMDKMSIKKKLRLEIMPNFYNAQMKGKTVYLGKPMLDTLRNDNIEALLAHEVAHYVRHHSLKLFLPMIIVIFAIVCFISKLTTLAISHVQFLRDASGPNIFSSIEFFMLLLFLLMPLFSWLAEYDADLVAAKCSYKATVKATLQRVAMIRHTDIFRDFYLHPSISKRVANLDRSMIPRVIRWYLELCSPKLLRPLP